jgi:CubicO group peptidase (beta-lactamase class C family)
MLIPTIVAGWVVSGALLRPADVSFEAVRAAAASDMETHGIPGIAVAIVQNGEIVFAEGFGIASVETSAKITPDTVFQVGSSGKMLTAAAVLELAAANELRVDQPIGRLAKGLAPAIADLTVHQLLAQTSGLRDMPGGDGEHGADAHARFVRSLSAADRLLPAGLAFSYSNIGYSVAGFAASAAAGKEFGRVIQERVFQPTGMRRSTVYPLEAMTWPMAVGHRKTPAGSLEVVRPMVHDARLWPSGYVFSSATDLARFAAAVLGNGRLLGKQVLHADTPKLMLTRHAQIPNIFQDGAYGYGLILHRWRGIEVAEHAGSMDGFAALVRMVPSRRIAVVALANGEMPAGRTVDAALELLIPLAPPAAPPDDGEPLEFRSDEMRRYVGTYQNRGTFQLSMRDGSLFVQQNNGPIRPIVKVGARRFVASGPNGRPRLRFVLTPEQDDHPAYLQFSLWSYPKR